MKERNEKLKALLKENGASLCGFADLRGVEGAELPYGVSVAVAIPPEIVRALSDGPNRDYLSAYHTLNARLDQIVLAAEAFFAASGYRAYAQTAGRVREFDVYRTALPHKTVATRAGLGWIGKSALLVTEEYGPAVRISSLVTDAPLECAQPISVSRCGGCTACADACPARAVSGRLWEPELDRDAFFDPLKCRKKAREISAERLHEAITLCGKCIVSCPHAQRYINRAKTDEICGVSR